MEFAPAGAAKIDARDADTASADLKLVLNRSSDGETPDGNDQSRLLFTVPAGFFDAPTQCLARAVLTLSSTFARNYDGRELVLHPLAAPFAPEEATWNSRDAETAWAAAGGDFLTNAVAAVHSADLASVDFDVTPLLADPAAAAALRDNGALVRFDTAPPMGAKFLQLTFWAPGSGDKAPVLRCALADPFEDKRDFAVSYIDSRDAATVFWEQGSATVGKVLLNGTDGTECRAILTMPESLEALPPARVQSVVAKFDAEIGDWNGEGLFLAPLAAKTSLERRGNDGPLPVHGPSWTCADASVDPGAASYVLGGETIGNTPWNVPGGDWMPGSAVRGTVTPSAKGTGGTAEFDLTALWRDGAARDALLGNGAIVFLDPAAFPQVRADGRMARVNLFRPDDDVVAYRRKHSWIRVTECEALAGTPATTYIDSAEPDRNFAASNKTLVTLNNAAAGTETRALVRLPDGLAGLDLLRAGSVTLLVSYYRSWPGDGGVNPIALHPAAAAFRPGEATWNDASAGTPWGTPGGDFLDAFVTAADSPSQSVLAFDLAPLLADPGSAAALAGNGAVIRMLGDAPEAASNNGYNVNGSATATPPVVVLAPAGLEIRGIGAVPDGETGGMRVTLSVAGLEPLAPYELWACGDLAAPEGTGEGWHKVRDLSDSGTVTFSAAASGFYRVQPAP